MSRGRPFEPGNKSGRGRPPGSRNKTTAATRKLLQEYRPALLRKAMSEALRGDVSLLRLFANYELDLAKDSLAKIGRLPMGNIDEIIHSHQIVINRLAAGVITPVQAIQVTAVLDKHRLLFETQNLAVRVSALEQSHQSTQAAERQSPLSPARHAVPARDR
jgi:hypothetical protein